MESSAVGSDEIDTRGALADDFSSNHQGGFSFGMSPSSSGAPLSSVPPAARLNLKLGTISTRQENLGYGLAAPIERAPGAASMETSRQQHGKRSRENYSRTPSEGDVSPPAKRVYHDPYDQEAHEQRYDDRHY
eukprot:CAMPEP_0185786024 /NCGR_PEP_ID=MMETSP1174-20130828/133007_1 /TAXON_ID=35687 /ORGANISM="Dictyocha speculum, Strain CCMP1381" /LENGTH=132 /DNA_ID=CAMNT_0028478419 /DNA_START=11 /DNA_END=406 /DNA_ORIENTATION=-